MEVLSNETKSNIYWWKIVLSWFVNTIDYITIAQTGNAVDFGDTVGEKTSIISHASSTRGLWLVEVVISILIDIQFITISTTGNATDFGDLAAAEVKRWIFVEFNKRIICFRWKHGGADKLIQYHFVTIATTGNAQDFGDLTTA